MPNQFTTLQGGLRVEVARSALSFYRGLEFHIFSYHGEHGGQLSLAVPLVMRTLGIVDQATPQPPAFSLSLERAQELMDSLWSCGLRPSEGTGSAGALAATQAHLKDMQTLTFKLLEGKTE